MRTALIGATLLLAGLSASPAWAQATTRACGPTEEAGPACLLAHKPMPRLLSGKLFWHLDRFVSKDAADKAAGPTSSVVEASGSTWLFTIERAKWRSRGGTPVSLIGPLGLCERQLAEDQGR